ncbi:MAG TPA: V-type ATP synthase subunit D [Candidatus Bathyarchaeota archaeon]|nr:V-type ATP synthase subunit D [Candidatus Bathyarchaeota archaeon]
MSLNIGWKTRPTRYELLKLREQQKLAKRAHDLLEDKYRMLNLEAKSIKNTLLPFEKQLDSELGKSYRAFFRAVMHSGLKNMELAAKSTKANDNIKVRWERVHGLTLPNIKPKIERRNPLKRGYGLSNTSAAIDDAAESAEQTVILLVTVSELRNTLRALQREVERTRIRVFALEKVLLPYLDQEIKTIEIKLEERERERHTVWRLIKQNRGDSTNI